MTTEYKIAQAYTHDIRATRGHVYGRHSRNHVIRIHIMQLVVFNLNILNHHCTRSKSYKLQFEIRSKKTSCYQYNEFSNTEKFKIGYKLPAIIIFGLISFDCVLKLL